MPRRIGLIVLAVALLTSPRPASASTGDCGPAPTARLGDGRRTMEHHDPVIRRALVFLGQPLNPVKVVGPQEVREIYRRWGSALPPPDGLNAFRGPDRTCDPHIYVRGEAGTYRRAVAKPTAINLLKLAATLVHEQVHDSEREYAAYRLQSDFVRSRLSRLPRSQREEARRYLQELDARARVLDRVEAFVRTARY